MEANHKNNWPVWAIEPVEIESPDPAWLAKGLHEVNHLRVHLAQFGVSDINHIGSTSVPNLPAKPIIDIIAKIQSYTDLDEIVAKLRRYNWNYVPPSLDGHEWRRFFVKVKDDKRECHFHLMLEDEGRWERQISFRDKLRERPILAIQYAELKMKLAAENKHDREAYTNAKTEFINYVLEHE
ncbi:GrpB family protein [Paenibacillus sp. LHD-117]|uniref:GrpB family protein n=1 Tax=Paenibacillus sp. LHD-117 TaxID=3071412 RepID=UPI0027E175AF|nr:GrpB family protein [Paenibacillus sp. LHD-117]MDQ6423621.1 GrpB family protein [Paenibacillus sp. LHD-117]